MSDEIKPAKNPMSMEKMRQVCRPQTAHTPGPWEMQDGKHEQGIYANWFGERVRIGGTPIVLNPHSKSGNTTDYEAINRANARLMTTAPELLAALESAERLLAILDSEGSNHAELYVVRHAIAKAKGGSQ